MLAPTDSSCEPPPSAHPHGQPGDLTAQRARWLTHAALTAWLSRYAGDQLLKSAGKRINSTEGSAAWDKNQFVELMDSDKMGAVSRVG